MGWYRKGTGWGSEGAEAKADLGRRRPYVCAERASAMLGYALWQTPRSRRAQLVHHFIHSHFVFLALSNQESPSCVWTRLPVRRLAATVPASWKLSKQKRAASGSIPQMIDLHWPFPIPGTVSLGSCSFFIYLRPAKKRKKACSHVKRHHSRPRLSPRPAPGPAHRLQLLPLFNRLSATFPDAIT